ncbi:RseC/MucC-like positive regulator of sigma(E) [Gibbsiella quercinecans]|uniref:SoxR reducing system protein RseC n=1 Tax=Gibbsiella quercinecans TaxID=929813 RepID=A0A250B4H9_9GAMM|nr:SoxR-reducing system protein RseC [Gibbsiella quercinecans]ATA20976.1 SoxR reducing system protein RseC [Gibbsiella quercinecans]RLM08349.1 SoxR reducing system protein RseC [Gibbsiella quercinecans]RLM11620.1 SoxR reducing system protein RseC [Gibbsiella quercinecans]RLM14272.1 SoxR reducing system protein RseC [Gibbsiella quercinecans]TCT86849.1 RseC/MucC-like positive regulator of sigma(E) [Gibbsiella quercinecans]
MMKEWATVISWQQGVAVLRCEPKAGGCGSCHARTGCGARALNELAPETQHQLQVHIAQPVVPGQRIEVGIAEGSLLRSAMLVYLAPLLGILLGAAMLQWLMGSDSAALLGALVGGGGAFLVVRRLAGRLSAQASYQPVVLQIGLPPGAMREPPEQHSPL